MKFSVNDFFSKCDQIPRKLRIWSHLLKKSSMKNFIFFAVTVEGKPYDLIYAKKFLVKISTQKISEKEEIKQYFDFIIPDINALEGKAKDKGENILNVLKNSESIFTGLYLYHDNVPKPESEESITERTKLTRQRSDEIAKKEKMIALNCLKYTLGIQVQVICTRL